MWYVVEGVMQPKWFKPLTGGVGMADITVGMCLAQLRSQKAFKSKSLHDYMHPACSEADPDSNQTHQPGSTTQVG
jgi:hypothetical protein